LAIPPRATRDSPTPAITIFCSRTATPSDVIYHAASPLAGKSEDPRQWLLAGTE
jgi:hypothetical protein